MAIHWNPFYKLGLPNNTPYSERVRKSLLVKHFKRAFDVFYGDVNSLKRVLYRSAYNFYIVLDHDERRKAYDHKLENECGSHSGLLDFPFRLGLKAYNLFIAIALFPPRLFAKLVFSLWNVGPVGKLIGILVGIPYTLVSSVILLADTLIRAAVYLAYTPIKAILSFTAALIAAPFAALIDKIALWREGRQLKELALTLDFKCPANTNLSHEQITQKLSADMDNLTQVEANTLDADQAQPYQDLVKFAPTHAQSDQLAFYHRDKDPATAQPDFTLTIEDITNNQAAFRALIELNLFNILTDHQRQAFTQENDEKNEHSLSEPLLPKKPVEGEIHVSAPLLAGQSQEKTTLLSWLETKGVHPNLGTPFDLREALNEARTAKVGQ